MPGKAGWRERWEMDLPTRRRSPGGLSARSAPPGGLDEFLIERYTAFTRRGGCSRYFDIWHEPWRQIPAEARISDDRLLRRAFPWFPQARLMGANFSPGARDVWMGAPRRIR